MPTYILKIFPARQKSTINFNSHEAILREAAAAVSGAAVFQRDGKCLTLPEIGPREMTAVLTSREELKNPARSLSALTRYLVQRHPELFEQHIYNHTLFRISLSQEAPPSPAMSNQELLKAVIDLVYAIPQTESVLAARAKIEQALKPFIQLEKGEEQT